ncbi:MAG: molecular chaperone DnaJ [Spirulina sp. SIO3F2]|nr:molecular chaperone DnaJ [Spirulina sp. SIO3F2]
MSEQNPYETLGVTKEASFEDIQNAKVRLSAKIGDDRQKVQSIEAAYDAIIMERLRMRQEGKLEVPEGIRFPERETTPSTAANTTAMNRETQQWLQQFVDTPDRTEVLVPTLLLGVLGVITLLTTDAQSRIFPTILSLSFLLTLYWLTRKENRLGRAILLTSGGLMVGVVLTISILGLGVVPVANGGLSSTQLTTVISLLVFWVISTFLR